MTAKQIYKISTLEGWGEKILRCSRKTMTWLMPRNLSFCEGRCESKFGTKWKNGTAHCAGRTLGKSERDGKRYIWERGIVVLNSERGGGAMKTEIGNQEKDSKNTFTADCKKLLRWKKIAER